MTAEGSSAQSAPGNVFAILQAVGLAIIAVIPAFLTGALAVGIRSDLAFGPAALGLAVAWFFVTSSLSSTTMGQLVERLGVRRSLVVGASASSVALIGLAAAPNLVGLLAAMTVGGAANALTQPAVNASLSAQITAARLGLAFGIKQAAIPAATLLGGLAVPTLAVLVGWRGTFAAIALVALLGGTVAWRGGGGVARAPVRRPKRRVRNMPEVGSLAILSAAGLLGAAAATSLGAFLVDAAVVGGMAETGAGLLMALASACGLGARILLGWYADTHPARSRYGTIALALVLGAPGYLLLTSDSGPVYVAGALLAYAVGWAWTGLFHFTVVSQNPASPAAATGVVQTGLSLGAGLGPLAFGVVAEAAGYDAAWVLAGGLSATSAGMFMLGRRHLRHVRRTAAAAHIAEVASLTWKEADSHVVSDGVEVQQRLTENLRVVLYRADPGAGFSPPLPSRTGGVLVLAGGEAHLWIGGIGSVAGEGDYLALPANRPWRWHNPGSVRLTLAQVEHQGNTVGPV